MGDLEKEFKVMLLGSSYMRLDGANRLKSSSEDELAMEKRLIAWDLLHNNGDKLLDYKAPLRQGHNFETRMAALYRQATERLKIWELK
jgi:hypothetical protein